MPLPKGLTTTEVQQRIAEGQINDAHERTSRSMRDILRANIFTRFNALLGILFIIVLSVGSPADGLFGLVIVINSAIGILQEWRAKRTLDNLAILHAPTAHVVRNGKRHEVPLKEVVLDDTIALTIGDQVPADGDIASADGLEVDESLLTGESDPIYKKAGDHVLSGSFVVAGHGYMQATAVGAQAYVHTITGKVKRFSRVSSELISGTNKLLGYISWLILFVAPLLVWGQIARSGNSWQEALVRSTAAIVGMIPEGLVLLTSLAFLLATLSLVRRKVLVQQLPAVEGLARVDVLCLDKTGTLTEGKIVFDQLHLLQADADEATLKQVLATFSREPNSPTLQALHEAFTTIKPARVQSSVAFSSARKWSSITIGQTHWIIGAPEVLLPNKKTTVGKQAAQLASNGQRVLLIGTSPTKPVANKLPTDLHPQALVSLNEKIRPDAAQTLAYFAEQDVAVKIISGDNPQTVAAIARRLGLPVGSPVDARELPTSKSKLAKVLQEHTVFGRVKPEQKRAIVAALQSRGHVVAMTGDGVNDALALKDADIGIAMGNGAQATKAVAELVLLDSQFSHMPQVLAEGRRVIANIERVANLFVIKNVYSLVLALAVTVGGLAYPFLPRHMTVLSALTIGIPAFFLALAPNKQRYKPGFLGRVLRFAVPTGFVIALLIFGTYLLVRLSSDSAALASTAAATVTMTVGVWVLVCLARPLKWWKLSIIAAMAAIYAALLSISFSRELLDFAIVWPQLAWALGIGALGAIIVEILWRNDQR